MEAIILCGGFAKRLELIGEFVPKALLTLNGRPLVDYIVSGLESLDKVERIILSTNSKFADQFKYWIKLKESAGFKKRIELVIEPAMHNEAKFGAVKGIAYAIRESKVKDGLLVIAGDNFYTFDLEDILKQMIERNKPSIVAYDIGSLEGAKKFAVLKVGKSGIIEEFEEKPENPKSSLISTLIYFCPKEFIGMFDEYIKHTDRTDYAGEFIEWLIKRTQVYAVIPKRGEWFDIGSIDGYREAFYKEKEI